LKKGAPLIQALPAGSTPRQLRQATAGANSTLKDQKFFASFFQKRSACFSKTDNAT
jgi:hypothetical protein